jgi:hypothetical protein
MSRFLSTCDVRYLPEWEGGRQLRMLLAPLVYESDVLGATVTVPAGLVFDGQSIPRTLAGLSGPECTEAGGVHDWLYLGHHLQMGTLPLDTFLAYVKELAGALDPSIVPEVERQVGRRVTRAESDLVYREILLLRGLDPVYAQEQYAALDFWGKGPWERGPSRLRVRPTR